MNIRIATPADAVPLAALAARVFVDTYGAEIPADALRTHLAQHYSPDVVRGWLMNPSMRTWIATDGDALHGFTRLDLDPVLIDGLEGVPELAKLYVERAHHGAGLGSRLLETALAHARVHGHARVWLAVWTGNPRAIAFYIKHGFVRVDGMQICVEEIAFEDDVMVISLTLQQPPATTPPAVPAG